VSLFRNGVVVKFVIGYTYEYFKRDMTDNTELWLF